MSPERRLVELSRKSTSENKRVWRLRMENKKVGRPRRG